MDIVTAPSGTETVGNVSFSHRMRIVQLDWTIGGLMVGTESSELTIKTVEDCLVCSPGTLIPWTKLTGSWTLGFPGGNPFASGRTVTIGNLDEWMRYIRYIPDSAAVFSLGSFLSAKAYECPLSWKQVQAVSELFELQAERFNLSAEDTESIRKMIRFYAIPAAFQEMAQPSPDPDIIAWVREAFSQCAS
jgi:hypothetical protein